MFCQTALEVGGEAHVQVAVVHREEDVDAVLEPCRHVPNHTVGLGKRQSLFLAKRKRETGGQCSRSLASLHRPVVNFVLLLGSSGRARTCDLVVNSHPLYH